MKKRLLLSVLVTLLLSTVIFGHTQHIHEHGKASGSMSIGAEEIFIELSIPAASVVGFEHPALTDADKASVATAIDLLNRSDIFIFYKNGGFFRNDIALPVSLSESVVEFISDIEDGHSEFHLTFRYTLSQGSEVHRISTTLFSTLPDLQKLEVALILDDEQAYTEFSRRKPALKLD